MTDRFATPLGELGQDFGLALGEFERHLDADPGSEVAAPASSEVRHTPLAQDEFAPGLGAGRDHQILDAVERLESERGAERRLGDRDRHVGDQIVIVADIPLVRRHPQVHVQVTRLAAPRAGSTAAGEAQGGAAVDAGGHVDLIRLVDRDPALAAAGRTRAW